MTAILDRLKKLDDERRDDIERWFQEQRRAKPPFITTSVDLRHSGFKISPVDTNLYPAGFHNLSPEARARAARFFLRSLKERYPQVKRVLIIPESHTRNLAYRDNLAALLAILKDAGLEAELGNLTAAAGRPMEMESPSGKRITHYPLTRTGAEIMLENGFRPDMILLNNDMTSGVPEILQGVEQPILPPPEMGWWRRRKSVHFAAYKTLAFDFCDRFSLDPWLFAAEFHACGKVDFKHHQGLDCVAKGVAAVLSRVRDKYREYGIKDEPYVFIKADSGTYGMGIMTARAPEEVLSVNKKTRNKMHAVKEGAPVSEVIIQEGVPTADSIDGKPAEPLIYIVDGVPAGGMWRVNSERDHLNNLNAAGMTFKGMCDEAEDECGRWTSVDDCHFRSFGLVAAIAALAAARERYGLEEKKLRTEPCA